MHALARDCLRDFCRVTRMYAAFVTATVNSGRVHSSRRRGRIGKVLLKAGALLTASAVAGSAEPAQGNVRAGGQMGGGADSLTPITTCHVLAVVPADISLISATAGVAETVIGERMGAVNPPCPCPLLSVSCLRASQDRLRAVFRVRATSMALSRRPVRVARGYVRLVERGRRREVRGRDACTSGWRVDAWDISAFTWAYLGTPLGSGRDLGRFGHV